jgi:hypothetical protein
MKTLGNSLELTKKIPIQQLHCELDLPFVTVAGTDSNHPRGNHGNRS